MLVFDSRIRGIPCQVEVNHFQRAEPGFTAGPPDVCYPPTPEEFEFTVLDRRGTPAPWIESLMTDEDKRRVRADFEQLLEPAY